MLSKHRFHRARFHVLLAVGTLLHPASVLPETNGPGLPLRMTGPSHFEIGTIKLNKQQRSITFPAVLNMNDGPMEYLLVTDYGKTHESILRTDVSPQHIHVAMLLLDAKGSGTNVFLEPSAAGPSAPKPGAGGGAAPSNDPSKQTIPGDNVTIDVAWTMNGKEIRHRAEELVFRTDTASVLREGRWKYNGSRVDQAGFAAQDTGSIISIITDPDALINNAAPGHDNDRIWTINTNNAPPYKTPLQLTIKLESTPPKN